MSAIAKYEPIWQMYLDDGTDFRISDGLKLKILQAQLNGEFFKFFEMQKYSVIFQVKAVKKMVCINPLPSPKEQERKKKIAEMKRLEKLEDDVWNRFTKTERYKELWQQYKPEADKYYDSCDFYKEIEKKDKKTGKKRKNPLKAMAIKTFINAMIQKENQDELEKIKKILTKNAK